MCAAPGYGALLSPGLLCEAESSRGVFSLSATDFLNPLMASPSDLPSSGSFLGTKTIKATRKITRSSGAPRLPNIKYLPLSTDHATPRTRRSQCGKITSAGLIRGAAQLEESPLRKTNDGEPIQFDCLAGCKSAVVR